MNSVSPMNVELMEDALSPCVIAMGDLLGEAAMVLVNNILRRIS